MDTARSDSSTVLVTYRGDYALPARLRLESDSLVPWRKSSIGALAVLADCAGANDAGTVCRNTAGLSSCRRNENGYHPGKSELHDCWRDIVRASLRGVWCVAEKAVVRYFVSSVAARYIFMSLH